MLNLSKNSKLRLHLNTLKYRPKHHFLLTDQLFGIPGKKYDIASKSQSVVRDCNQDDNVFGIFIIYNDFDIFYLMAKLAVYFDEFIELKNDKNLEVIS